MKRRCKICNMPLSYWNLGDVCFRHYQPFTPWKVRKPRCNPHAMTWPWDHGEDEQDPIDVFKDRSNHKASMYEFI